MIMFFLSGLRCISFLAVFLINVKGAHSGRGLSSFSETWRLWLIWNCISLLHTGVLHNARVELCQRDPEIDIYFDNMAFPIHLGNSLTLSLSLSLSLSLTNNFPYNAVLAVPLLRPLVWCLLFLNLDIPTGFLSHPSLFPSHSHSHSDHVIIASANILTKRILNMRRVSFRRVALRYVCSLRGHS